MDLKVKRQPKMEINNRKQILDIFRDVPMISVGFVDEIEPIVIPMASVLIDENLYIHGANASRLMSLISQGSPVSINATILDGMVLARSAFSHTMNYRSANLFGKGARVESIIEKNRVLKALSDKYVPGRWESLRQPSEKELKMTMVLAFSTDKVSGKIRQGPPKDDEKDITFPVWAGELPFLQGFGTPIQDPKQEYKPLPDYLKY